MLNEKRVIQMTKLAIFEETEERDLQPAIQYAKKDYVSSRVLIAVLAATALYAGVYAGICAYLLLGVMESITIEDILTVLLLGVLVYAVFIFMEITIARKRARKEYDRSKEKLTTLRKGYRTLAGMYEEEEAERSPERLQSRMENGSIY